MFIRKRLRLNKILALLFPEAEIQVQSPLSKEEEAVESLKLLKIIEHLALFLDKINKKVKKVEYVRVRGSVGTHISLIKFELRDGVYIDLRLMNNSSLEIAVRSTGFNCHDWVNPLLGKVRANSLYLVHGLLNLIGTYLGQLRLINISGLLKVVRIVNSIIHTLIERKSCNIDRILLNVCTPHIFIITDTAFKIDIIQNLARTLDVSVLERRLGSLKRDPLEGLAILQSLINVFSQHNLSKGFAVFRNCSLSEPLGAPVHVVYPVSGVKMSLDTGVNGGCALIRLYLFDPADKNTYLVHHNQLTTVREVRLHIQCKTYKIYVIDPYNIIGSNRLTDTQRTMLKALGLNP